MDFKKSLQNNYAREAPIDTIRAESLVKSSKQAIDTAKKITLNETALKSIIRELY